MLQLRSQRVLVFSATGVLIGSIVLHMIVAEHQVPHIPHVHYETKTMNLSANIIGTSTIYRVVNSRQLTIVVR